MIIKLFIFLVFSISVSAQFNPFPQNITYKNSIKPNNYTQSELNNYVTKYYDYWKNVYLKESNGATDGGGYYIMYKDSYNGIKFKTVSEAHGYGMLIFAYMAGYDKNAKIYFDGMYNMYDKHRSTINNNLMSWIISEDESSAKDDDAATDGDMDIAYSLLLADNQWGSNGKINYKKEAIRIMTKGIKESLVSIDSYRTLLGDWDDDIYSSRTSDWMPGHFKTFASFTNDNFWNIVADTIYSLIGQITNKYSPNTGLLPDFVVGSSVKPADPNFLEDVTDGSYGYNACRDPWRLSLDYALWGDERAKKYITKMLDFIIKKSNGNPENIMAGYELNGKIVSGVDYSDGAFTAPFVCAGLVDAKYQNWLNKGFDIIKEDKESGYFGNTLTLLNMLLVTGNCWAPSVNVSVKDVDSNFGSKEYNFFVYPNPANPVFNVSFRFLKSDIISLSIYDVSGKKVFEKKNIKAYNSSIKIDQLNISGVYILRLQSSNGDIVGTKKIIFLK